jgi:3-polyprenyl-4-hydroxybenzoate decarboxylase
VPLDTLDFTSYTMNLGSKMVLDAQSAPGKTARPVPSEVPDPRQWESEVMAHRLAWGSLLAVRVPGEGRGVIERLIARPEYAGISLIAAVSADVPLEDDELLLWGIFTRFDCARDVIPARVERRGAWQTCHGPLGIDATWKAGYPEPVANLPEVVRAVEGWWPSGA